MPTCYIVGAGDFTPRGFAPVPGDLVLAADGGYRALCSLGYTPDLLLGDFDSLGDLPLPPDLPVLRFPARKDDTDTGLALRHGLDRGYRDFALYGCAGGRVDHLLANLQSMARVSRLGAAIRLAAPEYDAWALTGPAPDTSAPDTLEPHASASHASAPDASGPAPHAPHTPAPHASGPAPHAPHTPAPSTSAPDASASHISASHASAPSTPASDASAPHISAPHTSGPAPHAPDGPAATLTLPDRPGGTLVSVFCHGDRAEGVTLTGLSYPLDGADLTGDFPLGVSNRRLEGQPATVSVRRGTLLIFQGV
ncbi:MAG: thiamine diphosphokinase [Christensenellales bacterium]|nr:thiamine diphosphokinase [Christensenellales bacterium]